MGKILKIIFAFLLLTTPVHALVMKLQIEDIPSQADFIITGTVIYKTTRLDDRGIMVWIDYTIQVEEKIKGEKSGQIVMSFAGGTAEGKTIIVTEVPLLEVDKKYILFGYENEKKYAQPVVGAYQGIYRIVQDRIKNVDFIVDYNWRQLEMLGGFVRRGTFVELDGGGALIERNFEPKKKPDNLPQPVWRDIYGNIIPQPAAVPQKIETKRGKAVTKNEYIKFIKRMLDKDEHRKKRLEMMKKGENYN